MLRIISNLGPSDFYKLISFFIVGIGLSRIFKKCSQPPLMAFVPGVRNLYLGKCAKKERDGRLYLLWEILLVLCTVAAQYYEDQHLGILFVTASITSMLICMVLTIRIIVGLCRVFGVSRRWIILWVFFDFIPALIWGFSSKYQPVNLGKPGEDEENLAGIAPAEVVDETWRQEAGRRRVDGLAGADGLHVYIRERTVKDFSRKRYLLKDIELHIPNGSLVMLLGGSGSGKTTLVNAITGYEKADAEVYLNGHDIYRDYAGMKYKIGFAPQQDLMRQYDTVQSTINDAAMLRLPSNMSEEEVNKKIEEVMELLGIEAGRGGLVSKKSGGQKKRISIGMELISDPELLILDEPDSGLDGVIARELFENLRKIADTGRIVIAITHTPDRVVDLFDKVIVLARDSGRVGRLAYYGTPEGAKGFFGKNSMEQIVMAINGKAEGGEGRADEFIAAYARKYLEEEGDSDEK